MVMPLWGALPGAKDGRGRRGYLVAHVNNQLLLILYDNFVQRPCLPSMGHLHTAFIKPEAGARGCPKNPNNSALPLCAALHPYEEAGRGQHGYCTELEEGGTGRPRLS